MKTLPPILRFRIALGIFITGLVLSGVTAFPLLTELRLLHQITGPPEPGGIGLAHWIDLVRNGLETTYARYPWVAYGTDWLAFGHLVIALFFIGPFLHPQTARANLLTGIAACIAIVPLALICGPLRGIPIYWQLIDCSFGAIGILPLIYCLRLIPQIR
jgi:hypothetical protein